jgi:hypothetical protein
VWTKDEKFTYPSMGETPLYFYPYGKYGELEVSIVNFRNDVIKTVHLESTQEELIIDKELSDLLPQGTYKIQVVAQDEDNRRLATVFKLIVGSVNMIELNKGSVAGAVYSNSANNFLTEKINATMLAVREQSEKLERTLVEVTDTITELTEDLT